MRLVVLVLGLVLPLPPLLRLFSLVLFLLMQSAFVDGKRKVSRGREGRSVGGVIMRTAGGASAGAAAAAATAAIVGAVAFTAAAAAAAADAERVC